MRVYNFSAGPAVLPEAVLQQVKDDLPDWQGSGMSVMEVSHRSPEFSAVAASADQDLRKLLGMPDGYKVLFLQGGATTQFAAIPMNLTRHGDKVDYVLTGSWSVKAAKEAGKYCDVNIAADAKDDRYTTIPTESAWQRDSRAAYLHTTPNETIGGVEYHFVPATGGVPLVADMSSTILSRPIDVKSYGLIYAGAQKNIGPAGITIVIVRDDLLERARKDVPMTLSYASMADKGSMLNTPPTFAWYVSGLVFKWLLDQGGLDAVGDRNERKAGKLYRAIDSSPFYANPVDRDCRSRMNIPFTLADPALDAVFLKKSVAEGLTNLKGHRSVGGMRASIYNAMPEAGVDALIQFMAEFERTHG